MQPILKEQQDWIVWATLLFGGAGAKKFKNYLSGQRLWMFLMLVAYFLIITIVLRNNHMKNQMNLLMMIMMMMMLLLLVDMEKS